ncbi:lipid A deacylase LpxR family protein [Colwellia sp. RSH04]|uniref:lipid A deacylase LpxR family protein n=1 Tax=Colwellia sp. RSH04 TaxID=2305464 RepID=UPI000E594A66|nr:lipid A deacylase LpxR family protein [Colwellia sp. RSH04]RHW77805.1 lipid A deacylase LpxR family protein [Colwellia sp. RSH04]
MNLLLCFICSWFLVATVNASQMYFQLENDVTFGEDGNYSNGMILGWENTAISSEIKTNNAIVNWQQSLLFSQKNTLKTWGLKVCQRMWTPNEIKLEEAQPHDRPYAGFLAFEQHAALYSTEIAQKNWLALGIIGPASGTEQLQGSIHKLLGASTPLGWQYQVENIMTLQLGYEVDYLLFRDLAPFNSQWEISTFNHNTLGNFRSDINVGMTFRWGANLEQSFGRLSNHFGHVGDLVSVAEQYSLLFFSRLQAGYRFNDLTFDGKLPYSSKVEFNPFRVSAEIGSSYYFAGGSVTWSFNFYNKEYHTDNKNWHGYGLLQFTWKI